MSNTNKSLFAEAVQELKKASRLRCIIAILISAALGIFTVIEGQKSILTASVMKWTAYFCIAFISMSLFFIYKITTQKLILVSEVFSDCLGTIYLSQICS